jgi:hypothetical protein
VTAAWAGARGPLRQEALRIARRGPRSALEVARREARMTLAARRIEAGLRAEARTERPILAGPFLGEVGFELLYWLPLLRAQLERNGIGPERVTVLTRGGASAWYADLAQHSVELFELVPPTELAPRLAARRRAAGDQKQRTVEPLDRELVAAAGIDDAFVLHPLLMYAGLRGVHSGRRPLRVLDARLRYAPLPRTDVALPDLPREYVVLRLYESELLPAADIAATAERVLDALPADIPTVVLTAPHPLDEHTPWLPTAARANVVAVQLDELRKNLAVQTEIVRGARALVCTTGGFSFLGPLVGTPTLGVHSTAAFNPVHFAALRRAFPDARHALAESTHLDAPLQALLAP